MKSEKILSAVTAVSLVLALSLCACGDTSQGGGSGDATVDTGSSGAAASEPAASDAADSDAAQDTSPVAEPAEATIEEQVLLDDGTIKVTATALDSSGFMGPELKLLVENNGDAGLTVQARNVLVNGYMVDSSLSADVAAGKKANSELTLLSSDLERCGITTIAELAFSLHVFHSDDWSDYLDTDICQITTSAADSYTDTYDASGEVLYEENGIRIVSKGVVTDTSLFGPELELYVENNSDAFVTIQTRDVSLNGFMVDPVYSQDLTPGCRAVSGVTFMSSQLEENSITDITEAELSFHIFDTNTWDTIADTAPVSLQF